MTETQSPSPRPGSAPTETTLASDRIAKRNVWVLVAAQAVMGAQLPMIFSIAGLAGSMLAPNPCWATLPISLMVMGSMLAATPLSAIMQRYGRAIGFALGALGGAMGGVLGAIGLWYGSFSLFCISGLFTGIYMSAQGFFRFAATDTASEAFRPKAISWVMAGGLLAAVLGPQLVNLTSDLHVVTFMATYAVVILLNLLGVFIFALLQIPKPARAPKGAAQVQIGRSRMELLRTPEVLVAIICATVGYALMNLVMTSTPIAVVGCGFDKSEAPKIVSLHVLAMYAPSFVTGHIIARFGTEKVIALGLTILACAGAVALSGVALENFYIALLLLGIGWNFSFIGATAMLTKAQRPGEQGRIQGMNDLIVFGGVTLASFASGGLLNCSGGSVQAGWQLVNIAMLPFLVLAGGALIWLWARPKETR